MGYLNLMTWQAVAKPSFDQAAPSLPIAGGTQSLTMGHTVFSVCVHPSVLFNEDNQPVSHQELDNILKLAMKFLQQQHPGLELEDQYKVIHENAFKGDLGQVRKKLLKLRDKNKEEG